MSDISPEEKLQMVQQLRNRSSENKYSMHNRERILSGKSYQRALHYSDETPAEPETTSSFQLRFLLAVLLFAAFIIMDLNDIKVAGITMEQIVRVISADYEDKLEVWVETFAR